MTEKIVASEKLADLSRQGVAFWQTYVQSTKTQPMGFVQSLFFGDPDWAAITRNPSVIADEERVARLVEEYASPIDGGRVTATSFLGAAAPKECGGEGLGRSATSAILSSLAGHDPALALSYAASSLASVRMIAAFGTASQMKKVLPEIVSGAKRCALALSEPGAGSDARAISSRVLQKGVQFSLSGRKSFVCGGLAADYLIVFAKGMGSSDEERERLSAFLVSANRKGIERRAAELGSSWATAGICHVDFDDVKITLEDLLGKPGEAYAITTTAMDEMRLAASAIDAALLEKLLAAARASLSEKTQFGAPMTKLGMAREKLASIYFSLSTVEAAVELTALIADRGGDFSAESAACRLHAAEECGRAAALVKDLLASRGMEDASLRAALDFIDGSRFVGGASDVLRVYIALYGGRYAADFVANNRKARRGMSWLDATVKGWWRGKRLELFSPTFPKFSSELRDAARVAREIAGTLASRCHVVFSYYGTEGFFGGEMRHEYELKRLANLATRAYVLIAALRRAEKVFAHGGADVEATKFAAVVAADRIWKKACRESAEIIMSDEFVFESIAEKIEAKIVP